MWKYPAHTGPQKLLAESTSLSKEVMTTSCRLGTEGLWVGGREGRPRAHPMGGDRPSVEGRMMTPHQTFKS